MSISLLFGRVHKITKSDYYLRHVCLSVRPSVRMEQLGSHWTDFHKIRHLSIFSKNSRENSSFIKIWQEWRVLYMKTTRHFWLYLAQFSTEWEMCQTKVVGEIKTNILFYNICFFAKRAVYEIIIITNIKDCTLWSVPSPELQLLSPTFLRSSNCSPSLWSVVIWFQRDSV